MLLLIVSCTNEPEAELEYLSETPVVSGEGTDTLVSIKVQNNSKVSAVLTQVRAEIDGKEYDLELNAAELGANATATVTFYAGRIKDEAASINTSKTVKVLYTKYIDENGNEKVLNGMPLNKTSFSITFQQESGIANAPSSFTVEKGVGIIVLSWTKPSEPAIGNIVGYNIYVKEGQLGDTKQVFTSASKDISTATVSVGNIESLTIKADDKDYHYSKDTLTNFTAEKDYLFEIATITKYQLDGVDKIGEGASSTYNTLIKMTDDKAPQIGGSEISYSIGTFDDKTGVKLSWNGKKDSDGNSLAGYIVERKRSSDSSFNQIANLSENSKDSYGIWNTETDKNYYIDTAYDSTLVAEYRIRTKRALNGGETIGQEGATISVKSISDLDPVSKIEVSCGNFYDGTVNGANPTVRIDWEKTDNSDIAGYKILYAPVVAIVNGEDKPCTGEDAYLYYENSNTKLGTYETITSIIPINYDNVDKLYVDLKLPEAGVYTISVVAYDSVGKESTIGTQLPVSNMVPLYNKNSTTGALTFDKSPAPVALNIKPNGSSSTFDLKIPAIPIDAEMFVKNANGSGEGRYYLTIKNEVGEIIEEKEAEPSSKISFTGYSEGTYKANLYVTDLFGNMSKSSDDVTIEIQRGLEIPEAPTGLSATIKSGYKAELKWTKSSSVTSYNLYYSYDAKNWTTISGINSEFYEFTENAGSKNQYAYFKVTALNGALESEASSTVDLSFDYTSIIPAPTNLKVNSGAREVSVSWDIVSVEDYTISQYEIFISTDGAIFTTTGAFTTGNSYILKDKDPFGNNVLGQYYFRVRAKGSGGEIGKKSETKSVYAFDLTENVPKPTVKNVEYTESTGMIIKWEDTFDDTDSTVVDLDKLITKGYAVWRAIGEDKEENYSQLGTVSLKNTSYYDSENKEYTYIDTTANDEGLTYFYKIAGFDVEDTKQGIKSSSKSFTITAAFSAMPAPNVITRLPRKNEIEVSWTSLTQEDLAGYEVYVSRTPEGRYQYLGKTGDNKFIITVEPTEEPMTTDSSIGFGPWQYTGEDGDRLIYYTNKDQADGTTKQVLEYLDLNDPFVIGNPEGERRRELYFKVGARNKSGKLSELKKYSLVKTKAPKENILDVRAGVNYSVPDDEGNITATVTVVFNENIGSSVSKYNLFREDGLQPIISNYSTIHWLDINSNNFKDPWEELNGTYFSGVQTGDTKIYNASEDSVTNYWEETFTGKSKETKNLVYIVEAKDATGNRSGALNFADYHIDTNLNVGDRVGLLDAGETITINGEEVFTIMNYNGMLALDLNGDTKADFLLDKDNDGIADYGFGWCSIKIVYP